MLSRDTPKYIHAMWRLFLLVPPILPTSYTAIVSQTLHSSNGKFQVFVSKPYTNAGGGCFFKTET